LIYAQPNDCLQIYDQAFYILLKENNLKSVLVDVIDNIKF